jgi:hypothetical protein
VAHAQATLLPNSSDIVKDIDASWAGFTAKLLPFQTWFHFVHAYTMMRPSKCCIPEQAATTNSKQQ